jgi:dihydrofolate reductase
MAAHVFIATSLDGFIARPDGGIDWLPTDSTGEDADHGYTAFTAGIDAVVMGRNTYELVLSFGGWHFTKPVVVLSSRAVPIAPELASKVFAMSGTPDAIVAQCAARGWHELYVDGGETIQRFLRAGLIDRMIITRIPVLIGAGIPLFGALPQDQRLDHVQTKTYANGLVQSEYRVRRA